MDLKKTLLNYSDLVIVLFVGTILRLRNITTSEFWYDEAYTGILMKLPFKEFWQLATNDPTPPLYYLITRVWTSVLGIGDFQLRLLSTIFGVLTILFVYLTSRKALNKEAAVISSIVIALSPFFIEYSQEARVYSLYGLVSIMTIYFLVHKRLMIFALGTLFMLMTHNTALFFVGPMILLYFWIIHENNFSFKKGILRIVPVVVYMLLLIFKAFSSQEKLANFSWIPEKGLIGIFESVAAHLFGVNAKVPGADTLRTLDINIPFLPNTSLDINPVLLGGILFALYIFAAIYYLLKKQPDLKKEAFFIYLVDGVIVVQLLIITLGYFTEYNMYLQRYMFPAAVFFVLGLGYILQKLLTFELILASLVLYVFLLSNVQTPYYSSGMKEIRETYGTSEKTLVFTNPLEFVIGRYYLGENKLNMRIYNPNNPEEKYYWELIPEYANTVDFSNALLVSQDPNRLNQEDYIEVDKQGDYTFYAKKRF